MLCSLRCTDSGTRRSLRGNVDRNIVVDKDQWQNEGRSLRGNVDRNPLVSLIDLKYPSRSLRGNVDRNKVVGRVSVGQLQSFPTWERG